LQSPTMLKPTDWGNPIVDWLDSMLREVEAIRGIATGGYSSLIASLCKKIILC